MTLILLFFLQLCWASSYVAQKMALAEMPLGLVLILRYGIASLVFLLAGRLNFKEKFSAREWALILFVGVINFSGSPYFQLKALTLTTATDTAILIAFEPLITALLAVFFLKERLRLSTLMTFVIATFGVIIMSGWKGDAGSLQWARLTGDLFFLVSLLCEGINSTASRQLTQKHDPFRLVAWLMFAGFVANCLGNWRLLTFQNLNAINKTGWFSVGFLSLFCSVVGYCGWVYLLKKTPLNQLALSLFLQPVLGSVLAYLILKERLDLQTVVGGLIVLSTLFVWLWKYLAIFKNKKDDTAKEDKIDAAKKFVAEIRAN